MAYSKAVYWRVCLVSLEIGLLIVRMNLLKRLYRRCYRMLYRKLRSAAVASLVSDYVTRGRYVILNLREVSLPEELKY